MLGTSGCVVLCGEVSSYIVKYDFSYPDDKFIILTQAVKELVDSQTQFTDWNNRDDIKAALKVGLILLLDKHGCPPEQRDEVYKDIFDQA